MADLSEPDRVAEWLKSKDDQEANATALVTSQAMQVNADQHAQDMTLAKQSRVPVEMIDPTNKEYFASTVKQRVDKLMLSTAPQLRQWLGEDFNNPKLAHDDLPALSWWDKVGSGAMTVAKEGQNLSDQVGQGLLQLGGGAAQIASQNQYKVGSDQGKSFGQILDESTVSPFGLVSYRDPVVAAYRWSQAQIANALGVDDKKGAAEGFKIAADLFKQAGAVQHSESAQKFWDEMTHDPVPATEQEPLKDQTLVKPGDPFQTLMPMTGDGTGDALDQVTAIMNGGEVKNPAFKKLDEKRKAMEKGEPADTSAEATFGRFFKAAYNNPKGMIAFGIETAAQFAPQMVAAGAATSVAGPEAGAATMAAGNYVVDAGSTANQAIIDMGYDLTKPADVERFVNNPQAVYDAARQGHIHGLITSLAALVSMGLAGNTLAKNPAIEYLAQTVQQSALDFGGEMLGEYAAGQKLDWSQGIAEIIGGITSVPGELAAAGHDFARQAEEARTAVSKTTFFQALSGQAVSSKLRERMPEKFQEFVERATTGGPVENLYVKGEAFQQYFQSQGIDPAAVLQTLGIEPKQLETALETGGDVVIPTAKYASTIAGSQHDQFMLENMKLNPNDMSFQDAVDFNDAKDQIMEQARQTAAQMSQEELASTGFREQIRNEVASRLQQIGRGAEVSRVEGAVYAELYGAMAEREGRTVEELMHEVPLPKFEGQVPTGPVPRMNDQFAKTIALVRQRDALRTIKTAVDSGVIPTVEQQPGTTESTSETRAGTVAPVVDEDTASAVVGQGEAAASSPGTDGPVKEGAAVTPAPSPGPQLTPEEIAAFTGENPDDPGHQTLNDRLDDVVRYLNGLGIDPATHTDDQIRAAVQAEANRTAGERSFQQAIALRKGQGENLARYGLKSGKKYTTQQIARALETRQRDKFGVIGRKDRSDEARDKIAKWMTEEVMFELDGKDPQASGVGWYSTKFQNALDTFGSQFQELVDDQPFVRESLPGLDILGNVQNARKFMTALIAVTSDGMKVKANFKLAADVYSHFRNTGEVRAVTEGGRSTKNISANLEQIGKLLAQFGPEGMHEHLMREATVTDLKKIAEAAGSKLSVAYPADRVLPQAAVVFGPKLGAFYANLSGAEGYLTMDRWWSRTFNRYRGQLLTAPTKEGIARVRELIGTATGTDTSDLDADQVVQLALTYSKAYAKKGFKNGTELERAANTVTKAAGYGASTGTEDSPWGIKDRGFMIDTVAKAKQMLGDRGHIVTVADIQAILWYYEKRLLGDLGARQTPDISYQDTAKEIVDANADRAASDQHLNDEFARAAGSEPSSEDDLEFSDGQGLSAADIDAFIGDGAGRSYRQGPSEAAVSGHADRLLGLPQTSVGPNPDIAQAAQKYLIDQGIAFRRQARYVQVDVERATRIAQAFEEMKHDPQDPEVKAAYDQLIKETTAQFQAVLDMGMQIEVIEPGMDDPYPLGPKQVLEDLKNGHIWLYPTSSGFGTLNEVADNPLLAPTAFSIGEHPLVANDLFRVVHDVFGHGREGVGFGASGEENTWQSHVRMFSPLAARAMTTETRGQNSWVNYGPHGEANRANQRDTVYADQKIGLLPDWVTTEGIEDAPQISSRTYDQPAYHGSPVAHSGFDLGALGTGEGVHDHGWGIYFSRSEAGADLYRSGMSRPTLRLGDGTAVRQTELNKRKGQAGDVARNAFNRIRVEGLEGALQIAEGDAKARPFDKASAAIAKQLRAWADAGAHMEDEGRTFTVDVPEDAEMLNYDGKQSDLVTKSLEAAGIDHAGNGRDIYARLSKKLGSDRAASEKLRDAGIPGLYYAKGVGELVVWDQGRVRIGSYVGANATKRTYLFSKEGDTTLNQTISPASGSRGQIKIPAKGITQGATIQLFNGADFSTVIHETGHFMYEMLRHFNRQPGASQSVKDDFQAIQNWHHVHAADVARDGGGGITAQDVQTAIDTGTTGDGAKDEAVDRGMHEQFAKAAEAYMYEGKAPSVALAGAFDKFRSWLTRLYKRMTGLGVNMTPEVRGVFDRMLATDRQIQQAQVDNGDIQMLFSSAEAMGMSAEAYNQLQNLHERARAEAQAKLTREIMGPLVREERVWWRNEKAKTRAEVSREYRDAPIYRVIQELRYGRGFDNQEIDPQVKLNTQAIVDDYGEGYIPLLPGATADGKGHRFAVHGPDGMHPDVVAEMYGFDSGKELLDALTSTPALDEAVKKETDRRMYAQYGDPLTDTTIADKAQAAAHNDPKARFIAAELDHLIKIAGKGRGMTWDQAKTIAQGILRDTQVGAAMPSRFLASERKAANRAITLMGKVTRSEIWTQNVSRRAKSLATSAVVNSSTDGLVETQQKNGYTVQAGLNEKIANANERVEGTNEQIDQLIEAKRQQLLNHALYNGARQVQDEVDRLTTILGKLNRGDKKASRGMDIDHVKAVRAIASKFGLAKADSQFDFMAWANQLTVDNQMQAATMANIITTYTQDAKPYQKLTVDELSSLWDAVDGLMQQGKTLKQIEIQGKAMDKETALQEMISTFTQRTKAQNAVLARTHTSGQKLKIGALSILSALRRVENWARDLDDGKPGAFTGFIIRPVMDALDAYRADKNVRIKQLLDIVNPVRESLRQRSIKADEIGFMFANKGELLHALLHTGNDSNLRKLLIGRNWATMDADGVMDTTAWDQFVDRSITNGTITKDDYTFLQKVWDLMEETKRPAQTAHRKIFGYYFKEVEAKPITNQFGTFRGGYIPAIADRLASIDGDRRTAEDIMNQQPNAAMFPAVGNGFTKNRVENYATPLALDLTLLPAHLDKVIRFTHLGPVVQQTAGLALDRGFHAALNGVDPTMHGSMLLPWLQRVASQIVETPPIDQDGRVAAALFHGIRVRTGMSTMFANVVNVLQQVVSIPTAGILVNGRPLMGAAIRFGVQPFKMRSEAMAASQYMRDRIGNQTRELMGHINDAIVKPNSLAEMRNFITKHSYFLQSAFQNTIDVMVWHAAYDQEIGAGKPHEDAVFEADSIIRRVMSDMNPESVSKFETGSAFKRAFTMFYSFFNGQANLIGGEMQTVMRNMGWSGSGRMFMIYLLGICIPAVGSELISRAFRGGFKDDNKDGSIVDDLEWMFFGSQAKYGLAMAPVIGQITTTIMNNFNDKFYDDKLNLSPVLSTAQSIVQAPASIYHAIQDPAGHGKQGLKDGITVLGTILGIPVGQLAKTAGYIVDVHQGKQRPAGPIDATRGAISGRDSSAP